MRISKLLLLLALLPTLALAQPQSTYYTAATLNGKSGQELELALKAIVYPHTKLEYSALWTAYKTTDVAPTDSLIDPAKTDLVYDMYAWMAQYPKYYSDADKDAAAAHSQTGGINREHCVPNSWWGGESGNAIAYTDLHHLVPSDGAANNAKSNWALGEYKNGMTLSWPKKDETYMKADTHTHSEGVPCLANASHVWVSNNASSYGGSTNLYEPADVYKGDFARMYLYVVCAYEGELTWQTNYMFTSDTEKHTTILPWAKELLLKWHRQDPVSDKERDRNNAVESLQGNRNPFIDYPDLVEYIWGNKSTTAFQLSNILSAYSEEYKNGGNFITEDFEKQTASTSYNSQKTYSAEASNAGIGWYVEHGTVSTTDKLSGTKSLQMRAYYAKNSDANAWNGALPYLYSTTPVKGLRKVTFTAAAKDGIKYDTYYSTDGNSWTNIQTEQSLTTSGKSYSFYIPGSSSSSSYYIKIGVSSSSAHTSNPSNDGYSSFRIDDIKFDYSEAAPSSISIADIEIERGEEATIVATTTPNGAELSYRIIEGESIVSISNGVVTGTATGTATIEASFAGDGEYAASVTTFKVTVNVPIHTLTLDLSTDKTTTATDAKMEWEATEVTVTADKASAQTNTNNYYPGTADQKYTSTRFYKNSTLTFSPANGITLRSITYTATSEGYATALASSTWTNAKASASSKVVTITPTDGTKDVKATIGAVTGASQITIIYTGEAKSSVKKPDGSETVDFTKIYATVADNKTVENYKGNSFDMTFAKPQSSTTPTKYYKNGTAVRAYTGNTITIKAIEEIKHVSIDFVNNYVDDEVTITGLGDTTAVITFSKNCRFTSITVLYDHVLSSSEKLQGWKTFYNADYNYKVDEKTGIYVATIETNQVKLTKIKDDIVKKGNAVLLKTQAEDYQLSLTPTLVESVYEDWSSNAFGITSQSATGYVLASKTNNLGFYKYSNLPANMVYLPISNPSSMIRFYVEDEMSTGMDAITTKHENEDSYSLSGIKTGNEKGLIIRNGKVILVK